MMLPVVAIFHHTLRASFGRLEDARRHVTQIDRLYHSTVETLAMAIDAKDDVTHSHVRRVQAYAAALAQELKVNDELTLKAIEAAALLHDTGKLAIPERILNKPGGLTPAEFEQMKRHVEIGANILSLVDFPYPVVPIVRCHHENWDGSGYPAGVSGTDIPIGARILSVVDCFDALTSDRPYRRAMTSEAAIAILLDRQGKMYDPDVVDAFIRIHADVRIAEHDEPGRVEVLQQINRSLQGHPAPEPSARGAAVPASARRGSARVRQPGAHQEGNGSTADVLALSTSLIRNIAPGASGAWFLVGENGEHLTVAERSALPAPALRTLSMGIGENLTGWVASNRQAIVNSDASLDLGARAAESTPPLASCLSVPLVAGQTLVAVLTMYAPGRDAFTEDLGRLVQMVAPHVAAALDAARRGARSHQPQAAPARDLKLVAHARRT